MPKLNAANGGKEKDMKVNKILINGIPALVWGEKSDKACLCVHGKMSSKESAQSLAEIAQQKGFQTVSFDLPQHGERKNEEKRCDIWNGVHDLNVVGDYVFENWKDVSLYACSLGAYFSLNAYNNRPIRNCLFQSPVLDMEYLINQMMTWFGVSEERLSREKEIETPVDLMTWDYYLYVKSHPVMSWNFPTSILYGGKDNLQSIEVVKNFVEKFGCSLTVSENSEHPFMQEKDFEIVNKWIWDNL